MKPTPVSSTEIPRASRENDREAYASVGARGAARLTRNAWQLLTLPMLLFVVLPILALFLRVSPASFWQNLNQTQVLQAVRLSLVSSVITVMTTILLGTPVAYLIHHRRSRFAQIADLLVDLPTVLPPAVAGVALLMTFGRRGLLGPALESLGLTIPFTTAAVVMAQTFVSAPLYIRTAAVGFAAVDCELKKAAALDGASRWQAFRYVIVPMAWAPMVTGAVMTWSRSLGEFGATILFAGNFPGRTQTMPLAIYIGFDLDLNVALTLSVVLVCASFFTLALVKGWLKARDDVKEEYDY